MHENSNKTTKSFLPPGMPTAETWRQVCWKVTNLSNCKEKSIRKRQSSKQYNKYDNKVMMMTCEIRSYQFLKMSLQHLSGIMSVDGQQLDSELCDFQYNANLNYENYKKQL